MKQIVIELSDELYDFMMPKNEVRVMDANFVENFIKLQNVVKNGKPLPKEQMTVRQVLELLSYGTYWRLVGARTGKVLCTSFNKQPTKEKYMELTVTDEPIKADFYVSKSRQFMDYVKPMVSIWVSGK